MKARFLCCCILLISISAAPAFAKHKKDDAKPAWSPNKVNAALVQARAATAEQRFQDAESLMLQVTQAYPQLVLPWVELGNAQMGLKKYQEAESSFKIALGMKPPEAGKGVGPPSDIRTEGKSPAAGASTSSLPALGGNASSLPPLGGNAAASPPVSGNASNGQFRPPQVTGPVYASLGEAYAHEGRIAEAQAAFDQAVHALPLEAAQYRSNETLVFFQTNQSDAQLAAAKQAIALDPQRAYLYYFEGQALVGKSAVDPKTQKLTLPPECADAFKMYLKVAPHGRFAAEILAILAAAGVSQGK